MSELTNSLRKYDSVREPGFGKSDRGLGLIAAGRLHDDQVRRYLFEIFGEPLEIAGLVRTNDPFQRYIVKDFEIVFRDVDADNRVFGYVGFDLFHGGIVVVSKMGFLKLVEMRDQKSQSTVRDNLRR